jgi:hypothetical protein
MTTPILIYFGVSYYIAVYCLIVAAIMHHSKGQPYKLFSVNVLLTSFVVFFALPFIALYVIFFDNSN